MEYPGQVLTEVELLTIQRQVMGGLGWLAQAVLGTATCATGLACTPTSPASMSVQVGRGALYSLQNVDNTAYSSLAADTTNQIVKQGLNLSAQTFGCPAPLTAGQSIVYLIEATYTDYDTNSAVLQYFDSANPSTAFTGPNGTGAAQNTTRQSLCSLQVVAGTSAATGSQTAPAPTAGYVPLYTVTVAYGATTITSANIAVAAGSPFIPYTLPQLGAQASPAASLTPNGYQVLSSGLILQWGTATVPAEGTANLTFPLAFPNACFTVSASIDLSYVPDPGDGNFSAYAGGWTRFGTALVLDSNNTGPGLPATFTVAFQAIGY